MYNYKTNEVKEIKVPYIFEYNNYYYALLTDCDEKV